MMATNGMQQLKMIWRDNEANSSMMRRKGSNHDKTKWEVDMTNWVHNKTNWNND